MCCNFTVGSDIVGTSSSFMSIFWKYCVKLCLVCKRVHVKWSEQRTKYLQTWSGTLLKNNLMHSFLTLGSEERQCKDCFSTTWHYTVSRCIRSIFIVWFLCRPAFASLVIHATYTIWWAGLNRQWCRSRHWSSSASSLLLQ